MHFLYLFSKASLCLYICLLSLLSKSFPQKWKEGSCQAQVPELRFSVLPKYLHKMVLPSCSITGAVMILLVLPGLQQQVKAWRSVAETLTFMPAQLMRVCTKKRFCNNRRNFKRSEDAEKITNAKHYPLNILPSLYSLIRAFSEKVFTFNNPQQISWLLSTLHIKLLV